MQDDIYAQLKAYGETLQVAKKKMTEFIEGRNPKGSTHRKESDPPIWPPRTSLYQILPAEERFWILRVNHLNHMKSSPNTLPGGDLRKVASRCLELAEKWLEITYSENPNDRNIKRLELSHALYRLTGGVIRYSIFSARFDEEDTTDLNPNLPQFEFTEHYTLDQKMYWSLVRFLSGENAHRLRRCKFCEGIFLAINKQARDFCPYTNHRDLFHREQRTKSGYFRRKMAERRRRVNL